MIGHLGTRVSALLDGQLGSEDEERAWAHVHLCHLCRDQVEREGWVKTRLAGLDRVPPTPAGLKGSLLGSVSHAPGDDRAPSWTSWTMPPGEAFLELAGRDHRPRRAVGLAAIGGGAVGAAMMGVLALGAAPASAPTLDRRLPPAPAAVTPQPLPTAFVGPARRASRP